MYWVYKLFILVLFAYLMIVHFLRDSAFSGYSTCLESFPKLKEVQVLDEYVVMTYDSLHLIII